MPKRVAPHAYASVNVSFERENQEEQENNEKNAFKDAIRDTSCSPYSAKYPEAIQEQVRASKPTPVRGLAGTKEM